MNNLIVPSGTKEVKLVQAQITNLDNGVILNRVWVITEAGRPPYQNGSTLYFESLEKAIEELKTEVN